LNQTKRNGLIWIAIVVILFALLQMFPGSSSNKEGGVGLSYSQFINEVNEDKVQEATVVGNTITGRTKDGRVFSTYAPETQTAVNKMLEKKVNVNVLPLEKEVSLFQMLLPWLPIILLLFITIQFFRQMQAGGNKAMGFGKSRARLLGEKSKKITFNDVAGVDEAKVELYEIVDFLKDPKKFQRLGGRIPRGVLLVGPPGTGKTLLAKAISGEASVPFFSISGSDFVEMFVGVGASRVRDMFEQAKKNSPCIVFVDEIDAVGRQRGAGLGGGNDEREQTLNQLLVEMDGFEENESVIIIAATNRPDILDRALTRPGRFDRQIFVANPDINGREQILKVHLKKIAVGNDVDPRVIARGTPGFSGADLANLVNEAALLAARHGKLVVRMEDLEQAKDKVNMGPERKSMVLSEDDKKNTAYHEAGHALVAFYTKGANPIHKATIIPRGSALGMVLMLPEKDVLNYSVESLIADIKVATGGRLAEEIIFGKDHFTTGASSDIKAATYFAKRMVTEWGMSEKLGFRNFTSSSDNHWGGSSKDMSEATAEMVDAEISSILQRCFDEARTLIEKRIDQLHVLAKALLEYETLTGEEVKIVLEGGTLNKSPEAVKDNTPRPSVPLTSENNTQSAT